MTRDDYIHACYQMEESGGHFASALAKCYYMADETNKLILQAAFAEIFLKFFTLYLQFYGNTDHTYDPVRP